ncbi:uncharacterized protein [Argopecten irradians]|uniref:uncharacterized protein isoform X2 n=1 Tax=Argopecten irradians TaxID=31199 RepID=UPI00371C397A
MILFIAIVMMLKALAKRAKTLNCFLEDLAWAIKENAVDNTDHDEISGSHHDQTEGGDQNQTELSHHDHSEGSRHDQTEGSHHEPSEGRHHEHSEGSHHDPSEGSHHDQTGGSQHDHSEGSHHDQTEGSHHDPSEESQHDHSEGSHHDQNELSHHDQNELSHHDQTEGSHHDPSEESHHDHSEGSHHDPSEESHHDHSEGSHHDHSQGSQYDQTEGSHHDHSEESHHDQTEESHHEPSEGSHHDHSEGSHPEPSEGSLHDQTEGSHHDHSEGSQYDQTEGSHHDHSEESHHDHSEGSQYDQTEGSHHDHSEESHHDPSEGSHHDQTEESHHDQTEESHHDHSEGSQYDQTEGSHHDQSEESHHDPSERSHHDQTEESQHDHSEGNHHDQTEGSHHDPSEGRHHDHSEGSNHDHSEGSHHDQTEGSHHDHSEGSQYDQTEGSQHDHSDVSDCDQTERSDYDNSEGSDYDPTKGSHHDQTEGSHSEGSNHDHSEGSDYDPTEGSHHDHSEGSHHNHSEGRHHDHSEGRHHDHTQETYEIVYNSKDSDGNLSDVIPMLYGLNPTTKDMLLRKHLMNSDSAKENEVRPSKNKIKRMKKKRRKEKLTNDSSDDEYGEENIKKKKKGHSIMNKCNSESETEKKPFGMAETIETSSDELDQHQTSTSKRRKKIRESATDSEKEKSKKKFRKRVIETTDDENEEEENAGSRKENGKNVAPQVDTSLDDETRDHSTENAVDENLILRDKNIKGLYIKKQRTKTPKGSSKNTRVYDNTHSCYFCNKTVLHINLHLKTHRNQPKVKEVLEHGGNDFTTLRKLGDDKHNRRCIEEGHGEIILSRRPNDKYFDVTRFGPCPNCREWVLLKGIKYHYKECTKQKGDAKMVKKRDLITQSQVLAGFIKKKPSNLLLKEVIPIMTSDTESKVAQNDSLITALGEGWVRRNISNLEKRKYYASARMRLCARLLIQLNSLHNSFEKKQSPEDVEEYETEGTSDSEKHSRPVPVEDSPTISAKSMWDFLKPQHFENVVLCALKCSFPNADDLEELGAPSNAIKLKYDIERMVNCKWAYIVKNKGSEGDLEAQDCQSFLNLMKVEWREKVTVLARAVLSRRKYDQVKELPSPHDIQIITKYLTHSLKATPLTPEMFRRIVILAETRLLLYNKRRTGELEVIKLQSYASRSKGLNDFDESLAGELTAVEKKLLETQDLMRVRGKRGRPVPVLIPDDARHSLMCLADRSIRKEAGVADTNPYLFPNTANSYARAYDSLKSVCSELHLQAPHQITSVSMRKYTATLTQMLNLDKNQLDWMYQHLGHTKAVHKEHYRQMSGLVERTQISKMFLIQDLNLTSKFKGKKLDEVDIKDIVFPEDQEEDDLVSDCPDQFSVPENQVSQEELQLLEVHEENKVDDDDSDDDDGNEEEEQKKATKKPTRQRWSDQEVAELNRHFQNYLQTKTTPKRADIDKTKKAIIKQGGILHKRANHLIIKKISNMNHAKH